MFHSGTPVTNSPGQFPHKTDGETVVMTFSPATLHSPSVIPRSFIVARSPSEDFPYTNCLAVHRSDFPSELVHVLINDTFPLTIRYDYNGELEPGCIGVSLAQRQWMRISEGARVTVVVLPPAPHPESALPIYEMDIELEFLKRGYQNAEPYLADDMIMNFTNEYKGIVMTDHEPILLKYHGEKLKGRILSLAVGPPGSPPLTTGTTGIVTERTHITFVNVRDSAIGIIPSKKRDRSLVLHSQTFTAELLGVGGLDNEFNYIRRVLASYELTSDTVDQLGIRHVRGIVLYGPPGTGKSLLARQIGKFLYAWEPKCVNGYDLVGKSASTTGDVIRTLFSDAEKEYQTKGPNSRLHIIVIDHLDIIANKRRSSTENRGEDDNVVNQLLSKMDTSTPNILLIGTANDLGAIDGTLLRPGRFDVQVEIPLPNESGRYQILNMHTSHLRANEMIDGDVNLQEIASSTPNFSGAEISGLIRCATSFAFNRHLKPGMSEAPTIQVKREDFVHALQEIRPALGVSVQELQNAIQNDIIPYDGVVNETLKSAKLVVEQVRTSTWTTSSSILLYGPPGSGKTALAASIARSSGYPFVRFLSSDNMVGYSEAQRIAEIAKSFADSQSSVLGVIVIDDIERLIDWAPKSGTYSNAVLQALVVLLRRRPPQGRRLLTIATSSTMILHDLGFPKTFNSELFVPPISSLAPVDKVLSEMALFASDQEKQRAISMIDKRKVFPKSRIGIKDLLNVIEMARQEGNNIAERLVISLLKWKESGK